MEKGVLIDQEVLKILNDSEDIESVKLVIEKIKSYTNQRIINKSVFEDKILADKFFSGLPQNQTLKKLKIIFGLSIEISNESAGINEIEPSPFSDSHVRAQSLFTYPKKIEVSSFTNYFRARFLEIKGILQEKRELDNLISINKLSNVRQAFSIIGMVYDKRITKNKNMILEVEDLTGKIKVLINQNKPELYAKAEDISLDSVIGFKGFGSREIFFANDFFFPDAFLSERKNSPADESVVFISDVHVGSMHFLEKNLLQFIDYLNMKTPEAEEAKKIKYLFVVGDLVAGVGAYPNQERELAIPVLEEQYKKAAELFRMIRKDIKIVVIPGNHDCVRLMEPQPPLDEKFAGDLYKLSNVIHASNPSYITIGEKENFPGFNILLYHGFSYPYYANNVPSLMTRGESLIPSKIMTYLLKNRHLTPTHSTFIQHYPSEFDPMTIRKIPDIFVSGHTHKGSVDYYKNILLISTTCWEELMPYQEKMGFQSDYCKVPMFNLKTRKFKVLDFYDGDKAESKTSYGMVQ